MSFVNVRNTCIAVGVALLLFAAFALFGPKAEHQEFWHAGGEKIHSHETGVLEYAGFVQSPAGATFDKYCGHTLREHRHASGLPWHRQTYQYSFKGAYGHYHRVQNMRYNSSYVESVDYVSYNCPSH